MTILQAIILGLVQGITEYLPISSSAHLKIVPAVFGWQEHSISFDLFLHIGTLAAIIIYFRKHIIGIATPIFSRDASSRSASIRTIKNIAISTVAVIPLYLIIYALGDFIHDFSIITVLMLIVFGILMIAISYRSTGDKNYINLTVLQAGIIGFAQSLALISGVSRSGITIMTALILGLKKDQASEYSFLISIPVILGGFVLDIVQTDFTTIDESIGIMLIGALTAFIGGYFAIKYFIKYLNSHSLAVFGYYRIVLAIILLLIFFV